MEIVMHLKASINYSSSALPAQFHQETAVNCQAAGPGLSPFQPGLCPRWERPERPHHRAKAAASLLPSAAPAPGAPRLSCTQEPGTGHTFPHTLFLCAFAHFSRGQPLRAEGRGSGRSPEPGPAAPSAGLPAHRGGRDPCPQQGE